jgi:hypothetical protein
MLGCSAGAFSAAVASDFGISPPQVMHQFPAAASAVHGDAAGQQPPAQIVLVQLAGNILQLYRLPVKFPPHCWPSAKFAAHWPGAAAASGMVGMAATTGKPPDSPVSTCVTLGVTPLAAAEPAPGGAGPAVGTTPGGVGPAAAGTGPVMLPGTAAPLLATPSVGKRSGEQHPAATCLW